MSGLTKNNPVTLSTALYTGRLIPGDILVLRSGIYSGDFTAGMELTGITIQPYAKENPRINGSFFWRGNSLIVKNLEIYDADFIIRESKEFGSIPTDIPLLDGIKAMEPGTDIKFINCIIHDCRQGVFTPPDVSNIEFNGCVIYYNGWIAPDRGHGHGAYIQSMTGLIIKDCIIFSQFGYGIHAYGEAPSGALENITVEGCTCFNNGILSGNLSNNILLGGWNIVANNPVLRANMTYGADGVNLGYQGGTIGAIIEDNYFPDGMIKVNADITIETNNYYGPIIGNCAFLRPNDYQVGRSNLTIYNDARADTVNIDVSRVYQVGDRLKIINVQDYFMDIQSTIVERNGTIPVKMTGRTVANPQGWSTPATTFPQFGCFVIEKV